MAGETLWGLVVDRADRTPEATALIQARDVPESEVSIGFGALRARAERVAAGLNARGVRAGTRVVWQLPTRIETVLLTLALARLGAVQSPVVPLYRDHEVAHVLRRTEAEFFLTPGTWRGFDHTAMGHRIAARRPGPLTVADVYDVLPDGDPGSLPPPPADPGETRWIYWTSGTTAGPKGVLHCDRALLTAGTDLGRALRVRARDVGSMAFPYAHVAGPDYTVMLLRHGIPAVLFEHFALPEALGAYRRHGVTIAGGSTAFYQLFLAEQRRRAAGSGPLLPDLRLLAGGGAPKPPGLYYEVVRELGCALTHGYALTEAPMVTMGDPLDDDADLATADGRPPAGMEIRIGADGEIRLRGPAVCQGYLGEPDPFDADGFLPTGDLGRLTPEGRLVVTGRLKDIIIRKGENVSAREIEDLLQPHPDIRDAAVIGLPDAERGELVCAVVEQRDGALPVTAEALGAWLRERGLAPHKVPERVERVDALPRGATLRKVLKGELRARFAPGAHGAACADSGSSSGSGSGSGAQGRKDVDACS
ncbi:class I adenylate-forming enzyme family protein [Streptomyces sp. NPDC053542]|uniref:class I adenylate-forming enzyme family protein n=1 Tax=Streptomyces sp. NPDC053542 TaxID=3365710 RepID=UPI0037D6678B